MRYLSVEGGQTVTFLSDDPEVVAVSGRVALKMKKHGFKVDHLSTGRQIMLCIPLECKQWEKGERRLIVEECIRLLNETISTSLLEAGR